MIIPSKYRSLLRKLYTAILQSELSNSDLKLLSEELRRGRISDELAYMLERSSNHFIGDDGSEDFRNSIREAENIIKKRRINKETLFNIIMSIDGSSLRSINRNSSIRQIVAAFIEISNERDTRKLLDVLSSVSPPDPYLKGISEDRE